MKKEDLRNLIEKAVLKVVEEKVNNLNNIVDGLVKNAICSLLGIEYGWGGKANIDHCNGRNSILTKVIEERAKEQVEKIVKSFSISPEDKEVRSAFEQEYSRQLLSQIRYYAEQKARDITENIVNKYTEKELEKLGFSEKKK